MEKYTTNAYLITCLTNLHVGSEGVNYGVVDKLVQRDTITEIPVINSSSLKGAFREFFKEKWNKNDLRLNYIFGPDSFRDNDSNDSEGKEGIGHYKFFEARLLSIPVRSDKKPFYSVTTVELIKSINNLFALFNQSRTLIDSGSYTDTRSAKENVKLEDWTTAADANLTTNTLIGDNIATFDTDTFKKVVKRLPVIARNKLENGESKNLWYEEVVPRESRFVFLVSSTIEYRDEFEKVLNNAIVQIGGNASIGYGFTKITKIS